MELTRDLASPEVYRLWVAIYVVGAALERRVWTTVLRGRKTYANQFTMLIGRPANGKSEAIDAAQRLFTASGCFNICPRDVNRATMIRFLASDKCLARLVLAGEAPIETHCASVFATEMGNMIRANDMEYLSLMTELFDNGVLYDNTRVYHGDKPIRITYPQLSILVGGAPRYLANTFPPEAWGQGFMTRVLMIYSSARVEPALFSDEAYDQPLEKQLVSYLQDLKALEGPIVFDDRARSAFRAWAEAGYPPVPTSPRLSDYNGRRRMHMIKLCMISSVARSLEKIITLEDFNIALHWLLQAEEAMPAVFLEMSGRGDLDILQDMWHHMWDRYYKGGKNPIGREVIWSYLSGRVPGPYVGRLFENCIEMHMFKQAYGTELESYIPQPRNAWSGMVE